MQRRTNPYATHRHYEGNPWSSPADGNTQDELLHSLLNTVRERVQASGLSDNEMADPSPEAQEQVVRLALSVIEQHNQAAAQQSAARLEGDPEALAKQIADEVLGWGPLAPYMRDDQVEEVILNNYDRGFVIYAGGRKIAIRGFRDANFARQFFNRKIEAGHGYGVSSANPYQDARLPDGSRLFVAVPPVAGTDLQAVIRRFRPVAADIAALVELGTITPAIGNFLDAACKAHRTLVVAGGTGTGKTTFLQALTRSFPDDDRVVTIEDTPELKLDHLPDWAPQYVRHEAEGIACIGMDQLVRNALRMRPTRIILGEARGGEMVDILTACNTGHDGTLFTLHANSPYETIDRMVTMYRMGRDLNPMEVRKEIVSAVHYIVHLKRLHSGVRYVSGIGEVRHIEGESVVITPVFESREEGQVARFSEYPAGRAYLERMAPGFDFVRDVAQLEPAPVDRVLGALPTGAR